MAESEQLSETKTPKVNEVNEFLEIASDFEDPLEVIRESLSNSFDAGASEIDIKIKSRLNASEIIIEDDGCGMNRSELESFFDLGNSTKIDPTDDSIGYKGHGTKIFYKSEKITVSTAKNGTNLRATMEQPWEKLNDRILPKYELTEETVTSGTSGTLIKIEGFKSGRGFSPESLTYNKIEHYLKWKTLAGSTGYQFDPDGFHGMNITVHLDDKIDDTRDKLVTTNKLEFPAEQIEPSDTQFPAARMCKHFGPIEIEVEYGDGEMTTLQVVGMVGGKEARNELPTYGRHSAQFGIWLAKDHIKVERLNEAISHDNEFIHFFFVANCQDLELSANREKIRNKSSAVYQAIEEKLSYYLSKVSTDPWFKQYLDHRRVAKLNRKAEKYQHSIEDRKERIAARSRFEPSNQVEVILALERSNKLGAEPRLTVEDYTPDSDVDVIINQNERLQAVSVQQQLTDHFEEDKPLESVSKVICWSIGDQDVLRELERDGYQGGSVRFDLDSNQIVYEDDDKDTIPIIEVSSRYE